MRFPTSDNLTKRVQPDRSKINMHEDYEVKYWTHALKVSKKELQKAVDKVGNSAAAVRKELSVMGESCMTDPNFLNPRGIGIYLRQSKEPPFRPLACNSMLTISIGFSISVPQLL